MTTYYRKSTDIVGYTFNAENLCPGCTREAFADATLVQPESGDVEAFLDTIAAILGIDRQDQHSFDSDEFPKVVFEDSRQPGETCGRCGGEL